MQSASCVPARRLKIMLVGHSAEPVGAQWDGKRANEWKIGNKTCPDIIKLKHVRNGKERDSLYELKQNSLCCAAGVHEIFYGFDCLVVSKKIRKMSFMNLFQKGIDQIKDSRMISS